MTIELASELALAAREAQVLLHVITKCAHQSFEQRLNAANMGINGLQYGLMRFLQAHPNQTMTELSRNFMLDPSTLVPVVDALERKGLVERGKDPNDRRRTPLTLTEEGEKLISRELPMGNDDVLYRALSALGEERSRVLLGLLRDMTRELPDGDAILGSIAARMRRASGNTEATPAE